MARLSNLLDNSYVGYTGSQGAGFTGSVGFVGSKGDSGFTGSRGATGFTGSVGFVGSKGDTGFVGSAGTSASIVVSDTPPGGSINGDLWFDSVDGSLNIYYNDGTSSQWVQAVGGSAGVGGATGGSTDKVFYENDRTITSNYTITAGKNAMTAGPITIEDGIVVTVPDGSVWTVV